MAEAALGDMHAKALATLLTEAEAADNVAELMSILGQDAHIDDDDSVHIRVGLVFMAQLVAIGSKFKRNKNGKVDWATVQRLKLVDIAELK